MPKIPSPADFDRLNAAPMTPIIVSGMDMFCLLGCLQLMLRHPQAAKMQPAEVARAFALELEKRIIEAAPAFKDVCAAGWDPNCDV